MSTKPGGSAVRTPIRQQVDHLVLFQIAENHSMALPLSPGPETDHNYTRRPRRYWIRSPPKPSQQRGAISIDPKLLG
jgi:hypothetical protein